MLNLNQSTINIDASGLNTDVPYSVRSTPDPSGDAISNESINLYFPKEMNNVRLHFKRNEEELDIWGVNWTGSKLSWDADITPYLKIKQLNDSSNINIAIRKKTKIPFDWLQYLSNDTVHNFEHVEFDFPKLQIART